jgi:hypothetical protein
LIPFAPFYVDHLIVEGTTGFLVIILRFVRRLYNDALGVGCSGCVNKVLLKLSDELVTPNCRGVAEVHMRYGLLGLVALRADISRNASSAFPNAFL